MNRKNTKRWATRETITSLPFGDAQTTTGSCGDPSPMHFTGKERDSESGLDNFGARYDSSQYGRFMRPDWSEKPQGVPYAVLGDPQSLNLYAYARNNPFNRTDPSGHCSVDGERHGFWWCLGHALGATETRAEYNTRITNERQWLIDNVARNNWQVVDLRNASATTVDRIYQAWDRAISKAASGEEVYGAKDFHRDTSGKLVLYRGGPSFEPKPGEYKLNADGTVKTTRGLSTNTDPLEVERFGGAYEIKMMPPELRANQWGKDPGHYELVPAEEGFTFEQVLQFLRSIITRGPKE